MQLAAKGSTVYQSYLIGSFIHDQLYSNLLAEQQLGFRPRHSSAAVKLVYDITSEMQVNRTHRTLSMGVLPEINCLYLIL